MKAYRVELLIIDHDHLGAKEISLVLENVDCLAPSVMAIQEREIGNWSDDHPLNRRSTRRAEYERLFAKEKEE